MNFERKTWQWVIVDWEWRTAGIARQRYPVYGFRLR